MPYKNKRWIEIKAEKTPEEWKKIRRAYSSRRLAKEALHKEAMELIEKIYTRSFISDLGLAKNLRSEIYAALRMPNGWLQKDYDAAVAHLAEAKRAINSFIRKNKHVNNDLLDAILLSFRLSNVSAEETLEVLQEAMLRIGNDRETGEITECKASLPEFVYALCKQTPGFYPAWFPKIYAQQGIGLLTQEDKQKVIKMLQTDIDKAKDIEFLAKVFEPDEDEKDTIEF